MLQQFLIVIVELLFASMLSFLIGLRHFIEKNRLELSEIFRAGEAA
jgi:hypothetical protein